MGMYTEINIGISFKEDTPENFINIIKYLLGDITEQPELSQHNFFNCDRWRMILTSDSYYFDSITYSKMEKNDIDERYHLNVRSNLKNYSGEIEKFLDFISSHIETDGFIGYMRYEESENPTLIYNDDGKIIYKEIQ